jgi:uncharacterized protein
MNADSPSERPLALVTGASSGIGKELAREFAMNGFDVVITAEDDELYDAAKELSSADGGDVQAIRADLSTATGVQELDRALRDLGRDVDAAALNAGVGVGGDFASNDLDDELRLIDLNVRSTVHLTKLLLDQMVPRATGRLLFTASIAATTPGPYYATYAASKAFVHRFAEAIRLELQDTQITVTSLMPGPTDTEFFARADMEDTAVGSGSKDDPADIARDGFQALMTGKDHIVAGATKNKIQAAASELMPDKLAARMHAAQTKPGSGE